MHALLKWTMAVAMAAAATSVVAAERISILDYCDPADPGWAPTGGCLLKEGDVTFAEFNALLTSVLSPAVVGHPAWRFEPSFAEPDPQETVRAVNLGGRGHTFTEVAEFGGGMIPPLSKGLIEAPECVNATVIPPGGSEVIRGLAEGEHRFQCCIHPWMRALIKVEAKQED
jgi:plastocyanin